MERFNNDIPLDSKILKEIEQYFRYRWTSNRNQAIENQEDLHIFIQLPHTVQMQIFSDYLYNDFLHFYGSFFQALRTLLLRFEKSDKPKHAQTMRNSFVWGLSPEIKAHRTMNSLVLQENFYIF